MHVLSSHNLTASSPSKLILPDVLLHQGIWWSHSPSTQVITLLPSIASVWSLQRVRSSVPTGYCLSLEISDRREWPCQTSRSGGRYSKVQGKLNRESGNDSSYSWTVWAVYNWPVKAWTLSAQIGPLHPLFLHTTLQNCLPPPCLCTCYIITNNTKHTVLYTTSNT